MRYSLDESREKDSTFRNLDKLVHLDVAILPNTERGLVPNELSRYDVHDLPSLLIDDDRSRFGFRASWQDGEG